MSGNQKIFRVRSSGQYFTMHKQPINNKCLSLKAKGLLAYLMSKPDDWDVYLSDIIKNSSDGKASVYSGIKELIDANYIKREKVREEGRFSGVVYYVYDQPYTDFPDTEKPYTEKPDTENPTPTKNKDTKNKETKNNQTNDSDAGASRDPLKHPAIIAYREIARLHVPIPLREDVIKLVGEEQARVSAWRDCVKEWIGKGWKPTNVIGMMDYFQNGGSKGPQPKRKAESKYLGG